MSPFQLTLLKKKEFKGCISPLQLTLTPEEFKGILTITHHRSLQGLKTDIMWLTISWSSLDESYRFLMQKREKLAIVSQLRVSQRKKKRRKVIHKNIVMAKKKDTGGAYQCI